ncbi:MAG: VOC family protein [Alphaproteobacteria bacterium]|nr:VOC family protein [Alphaproteobacteria bacterium]
MQIKNAILNHVALLVPSIEKAANYLRPFSFETGPTQEWDGEGTKEIYVGNTHSQSATLLLMEPMKDGAYSRAMQKRGPGLHHLAIDVLNLESYIDALSGSGWLLHPRSLKTIQASRTAWLARPGIPTLIEVQERDVLDKKTPFISKVRIPGISAEQLKMFHALGIQQACEETDKGLTLVIQNHKIRFEDLV